MTKSQIERNCLFCEGVYHIYKSRKNKTKYCSRSCKGKALQVNRPDLKSCLPHSYGPKHPNWNGGKWKDHQGYIHLRMPEHPRSNPRGYIREHRYVMEQYLGRALDKSEHIHHINGDKTDNSVNNLQLFKNAREHANHHISLTGKAHGYK